MAGVQMLRSRISTILAALTLIVGTSMLISAAAQADAVEKVTICHANNAATNPYVLNEVPLSSVDGEGNNDHTLHTGPIAISEEHAAQLKASDEDWGDIIPPFGGYPGLNWDETGIEIYENDCEYVTATDDDGTVDDGSTDDGSADDGSTDDGSADDGSTDDGNVDDGSTDDGNVDDGSTDDDGNVDDGSTDDGSADDDGSVDDGSTDDGSADAGTEVQGETFTKPKPKPDVEGNVLAQTGPETTILSIVGSLFLMLGLALRFGSRPAAAASTQTQVADAYRQRARGWTCAR